MNQRYVIVLLSVLVGILCLSWTINIFLTDEQLVSYVSDDAFYYIQVADNIVGGQGSTFDGINPTNGYHPLWMVTLVILRGVFSAADKIAFLRIILLFQALLSGLTIGLIWDSLRSRVRGMALLAGLLFFSITFFRPITGLETALVSLGMALAVWLLIRDKSVLLVGLSLALIFFSRLDFALVAGFLGLGWIWNHTKSFQIREMATLGLRVFSVPIILGLIYMALNQAAFGHPLPITFTIKTYANTDMLTALRSGISNYWSRSIFAPLLLFPLLMWIYRRRTTRPVTEQSAEAFQHIVIVLGCGSFVHIVYMYLSVGFGAAAWHLIPHGVAYAVVIAAVLDDIKQDIWIFRRGWIEVVVILIIIGISVLSNFRTTKLIISVPETNTSVQLYRAALWIRDNTPPDAIIALKDAGTVGYFSGRSVINLDGLINSFDTYQAIIDGKLCDKLNDEWHVDYFVSILPESDQPGYGSVRLVVTPWAATTQIEAAEAGELFRTKKSGAFTVGVWNYADVTCHPMPLA